MTIGVAACYTLYDQGSIPGTGMGFSFRWKAPRGLGARAVSFPAVGRHSPGSNAIGAWRWPLTPSSAQVKNIWSYTIISPYVLTEHKA